MWIPYQETKPDVAGLYLVIGIDSSPTFRGAYWYDPKEGWSGLASTLEYLITHWTGYPEPPTRGQLMSERVRKS
jgi:hypothetical protein